MKVGAVVTDLLLFSRIDAAARRSGAELIRVDDPADLPADLDLVLVDWASRRDGWTASLRDQSGRVILFGPHTDLESHAAARAADLGPMWARSKLVTEIDGLLSG